MIHPRTLFDCETCPAALLTVRNTVNTSLEISLWSVHFNNLTMKKLKWLLFLMGAILHPNRLFFWKKTMYFYSTPWSLMNESNDSWFSPIYSSSSHVRSILRALWKSLTWDIYSRVKHTWREGGHVKECATHLYDPWDSLNPFPTP